MQTHLLSQHPIVPLHMCGASHLHMWAAHMRVMLVGPDRRITRLLITLGRSRCRRRANVIPGGAPLPTPLPTPLYSTLNYIYNYNYRTITVIGICTFHYFLLPLRLVEPSSVLNTRVIARSFTGVPFG